MTVQPDFSGWATKAGVLCTDGRIIDNSAFAHQDGIKVPLVWQHKQGDPVNVLGHAILEHRDGGTYTYGFFNTTESGQIAKELVHGGDIEALSIYATRLQHESNLVKFGDIQEVSLVIQGANNEAKIDVVSLRHSADGEDEFDGIITTGLIFDTGVLAHADSSAKEKEPVVANEETKTVQDVLDEFTEEQTKVVNYVVATAVDAALDEAEGDEDPEAELEHAAKFTEFIEHSITEGIKKNMTNAFENQGKSKLEPERHGAFGSTLNHAQVNAMIREAADGNLSLKAVALRHGQALLQDPNTLAHGITNLEYMFPEARTVGDNPELISRQADWVPKVLDAVKKVPFARIKTLIADITGPEARAKGYVTGDEKTEEVLELLRRTTGPTTIYKKQALDRDDIIDVTEFDVIAWLKWEIRFMLNEELARAILVGDGRPNSSKDKIKDPAGATDGNGIRSIVNDDALYSIKLELAANVAPDAIIDSITYALTDYRGSGNPTFYTSNKILVDLLLLKDKMNRRLYETLPALAAALGVKEIVTVEAFQETATLVGILVNLTDYSLGTNRGGELTFFSDFDIDFNKEKMLLETRLSGALTKPKSAIVVTRAQGTLATVTAPSFDGATNTIEIPTATGVDYLINGEIVTGDVEIDEATDVDAAAKPGFYLAPASTRRFNYTPTAI
jgi:hypothetical protein